MNKFSSIRLSLLLVSVLFLSSCASGDPITPKIATAEPVKQRHAITYEYHAGRFGDKMLGYAQARYLSYVTKLPFLYRPFEYSLYLTIDNEALPFDPHWRSYLQIYHINSADTLAGFFKMISNPLTPPTLFFVDYFPSDLTEWDWPFNWWTAALTIPWNEKGFSEYLRNSLQPRVPIPDFRVEGRLNVADHIRTLSGGDRPETSILCFPLKHPNFDFHERQIRRVYEWNAKKPMHVFLFSDTKTPEILLQEFRNRFKSEDILFNMQILDNPEVNYVVQDFFAMQKFNVLIATQSNFSMMAARLGSFDMVITPIHSIGDYPNSEIDEVQVVTRHSEWFPYALSITLREQFTRNHPARKEAAQKFLKLGEIIQDPLSAQLKKAP